MPEQDRLSIAEILYGFIKRDYEMVARIHVEAGYIPKDADLYLFAQSCRAIGESIAELPVKDISIGKLLLKLFEITERFGMQVQPQLLLLQKTMITLEGIGQILNPDINMWKLIDPWITKWAIHNLSIEGKLLRYSKKLIERFMRKLKI